LNLQSLSGAEPCYGETVRAVRELEKYRDALLTITIGYGREMELRHLRYFVAVAEAENVSRAALKLHVSQPGISNQVHDLEDEIGFALFERTGKSVRLSAAGKIFLVEARDVLQRAGDAVAKARAALATQAEINVGYAPSGTVEILPRALRAFRGSFPGVRVTIHDLSAKEMLPLLLQKKLDIALTLPPRKLPGELDMKELERYEPCVVVGATHPLTNNIFPTCLRSDPYLLPLFTAQPLAAGEIVTTER
jgi:DNA-binding transcriptional LysR family regulator